MTHRDAPVIGSHIGLFRPTPDMFARGSEYGPLQSDGRTYLCPECGGYGYFALPKKAPWWRVAWLFGRPFTIVTCEFCAGLGEIPLDDPRVYRKDTTDDTGTD